MRLFSKSYVWCVLMMMVFVLPACETDDDPIPEDFEVSYPIEEHDGSGVFGNITFRKEGEEATAITVEVDGTNMGAVHPVRVYDTDPNGANQVLTLPAVDGGTGLSEALITQMDDGTQTTYEDWVSFNGYVLIYQSAEVMEPIAFGLIGDTDPSIPGGLNIPLQEE